MAARFDLVPVDVLRPHESTDDALVVRIVGELRRDGQLRAPILVADGAYVILDGHHRYEALRRIGCSRIPSYVVDYESEEVELTTWPGAVVDRVTKQEVLERGTRGNLFPPKTTRHILRCELPEVTIDLEDLM